MAFVFQIGYHNIIIIMDTLEENEIIVAVTGCVHGKIDKVYSLLNTIRSKLHIWPELVICTGDFEAHRDVYDLEGMNAPEHYMEIGNFHKYYRNEESAPYLTLVVGGNHEACTYQWELFYGGWLCPNIYYLGECGSVYYRGLRIIGVSGIDNPNEGSCLSAFICLCFYLLFSFRLYTLSPICYAFP